VSDLAAHFVAVPDMLELDSLTIYGEVYFGARCCLKVREAAWGRRRGGRGGTA